jgi:GGDEF domain-containing protein
VRDATLEEGVRLGERLAAAVRASAPTSADARDAKETGAPSTLGVSVGVAALVPGDSPASWLARADAALYESKRAGRGGVTRAP